MPITLKRVDFLLSTSHTAFFEHPNAPPYPFSISPRAHNPTKSIICPLSLLSLHPTHRLSNRRYSRWCGFASWLQPQTCISPIKKRPARFAVALLTSTCHLKLKNGQQGVLLQAYVDLLAQETPPPDALCSSFVNCPLFHLLTRHKERASFIFIFYVLSPPPPTTTPDLGTHAECYDQTDSGGSNFAKVCYHFCPRFPAPPYPHVRVYIL